MACSLEQLTQKMCSYTNSLRYLSPGKDKKIRKDIKAYLAKNKTRLSKKEFERITKSGKRHQKLKAFWNAEYTKNVVKPYIIEKAKECQGKNFLPSDFIEYLNIEELPDLAVSRAASELCLDRYSDLVSVIAFNGRKYYRYDPECAELMRGPIVQDKTSCRGAYCGDADRCLKYKTSITPILHEKQDIETLIKS